MNKVIHFDVYAKDPERAMKFYEDVFNWQFEQWKDQGDTTWDVDKEDDGGEMSMNYWMIKAGSGNEDGIHGGMIKRMGPEPTADTPIRGFVCTIGVDSIDKYIEKVKTAGGSVAMGKTEVKNMGWMASIRDTEGNSVGLMQFDRDR